MRAFAAGRRAAMTAHLMAARRRLSAQHTHTCTRPPTYTPPTGIEFLLVMCFQTPYLISDSSELHSVVLLIFISSQSYIILYYYITEL